METMQGMFMLPFDNRSFVFSYVLVLGAHTLITKTLLIWVLFFAVASWSAGEITLAVLCGCMACVVTAAGYQMCRNGHVVLAIFWAACILAAILLVRRWAVVLAAATISFFAAVLYLAFTDAYGFYSASISKRLLDIQAIAGTCLLTLCGICWQIRATLSILWACARLPVSCRSRLVNFKG